MLDHWSEAEEVRAEQSRGRYLENKLDLGFLSKKDTLCKYCEAQARVRQGSARVGP